MRQENAFQTRKQAREDLAYIKARYGVYPEMRRYTQADETEFTQLEKLKLGEAAASLNILRQELAKYSQAFLTFCNLRRLRLVKTLQAQEPSLQAIICFAGRTFHKDRSVYLATSGEGLYSLPAALHHELFHLSDSAQIQRDLQADRLGIPHHSMASVIYQEMYDREWEQLNPQGAKVYIGQDNFSDSPQGEELDLPGFALASGSINPWEDRATIAGFLLIAPQAALTKAQQDQVFCAKLTRIMTFYKERSGEKMDESYFADLAAGKVTEDYWNPHSAPSRGKL